MSCEEKLKYILQSKDKLIYPYDLLRLNSKIHYDPEFSKAFLRVKKSINLLDSLINEYVSSMPNCFEVVTLQDVVIENEHKVEIKTNITGYKTLDDEEIEIIFAGSIPSDGYVELSYENKECGIEISARNNVPKSVIRDYGFCGYHYCDPTTSKFFAPGVYQIEKGTVIGIGIKHQKDKRMSLEIAQN